jgi:hypothetical protein
MHGKTLKTVPPLSNNIIMQCIASVLGDMEELTRIKCTPLFYLQVDESTNVSRLPLIRMSVKHSFEENLQKVFIFCLQLSE